MCEGLAVVASPSGGGYGLGFSVGAALDAALLDEEQMGGERLRLGGIQVRVATLCGALPADAELLVRGERPVDALPVADA
jgi:hypothetical protein